MTIGRGPACFDCKHFEGPWQCAAFKRIPDEIAFEGVPHLTPYPGDKGIRFEQRSPKEPGAGS